MQPGQRSGVQPSLGARLDGVDAPPGLPPGPVREPSTEEMPRYPCARTRRARPWTPSPTRAGPGRTARSARRAAAACSPRRSRAARSRTRTRAGAATPTGTSSDDFDRDFDRTDDDADFDELEPDEDLDRDDDLRDASPLREWLIMAGQLAVGVLAGGAVWLGFNWLWGALPQAALVLALLVTAGMVLIVRKIRRAEDLQTTVFAVLVGLLATVSPVVLLLVNK